MSALGKSTAGQEKVMGGTEKKDSFSEKKRG